MSAHDFYHLHDDPVSANECSDSEVWAGGGFRLCGEGGGSECVRVRSLYREVLVCVIGGICGVRGRRECKRFVML